MVFATPREKSQRELLQWRWCSRADEISQSVWRECFPQPLEGQFWYETLESSGLEDQFEFLYLVVSDDDKVAAVAPAFVMNVPLALMAPEAVESLLRLAERILPALGRVRTLFIGSPCADEGTVGIAKGYDRAAVFDTVARAAEDLCARRSIPMIVWKDFRARDAAVLDHLASQSGLLKICSYPGTELELPSGSFDDYLLTLKKTRRQNLKKKLATSRQTACVQAEIVSRPDEELIVEMFPLFLQTFQKGKTKFERLNQRFFQLISSRSEARFLLLREAKTGKLLAFRLFFHLNDTVINKFIGIDYGADRNLYLLFRLWEEGVRYALANGARVIQSGQTGYGAKLETGHHLVPLYNYFRHRNPLVHKILTGIAGGISWETVDSEVAEYLKAHPTALPPV